MKKIVDKDPFEPRLKPISEDICNKKKYFAFNQKYLSNKRNRTSLESKSIRRFNEI